MTGVRGFTLIEMLIVLVLISISVALIYPSLFAIRDRYDSVLDAASKERDRKKQTFTRFVTDGLPQKTYSSAARP